MGAFKNIHVDTEADRLREENEALREELSQLQDDAYDLVMALLRRSIEEPVSDEVMH
jgi:hypothetical protein